MRSPALFAPLSRRHQRGVGLIEVLIAVLVVSIGVLGIAALQARSLSTNNSAMARSMATIATYSILDAMRADRDNALDGQYSRTVNANDCDSAAGGNALATEQLQHWCKQLREKLGGEAQGDVSCGSSGYCTITIEFNDSRAGGSDQQQVITKAGI